MQAARKVRKKMPARTASKKMENESEQDVPARTQPKPSVPIPLLIA